MSTTITNIAVNGVDDKRITLATSAWAAKFSFGSSWGRLRIGYRMSIADAGGQVGGVPRLFVGLLADPSHSLENSPLTDKTSHFIGSTTTVSAWTYGTSNSGLVEYDCGSTNRIVVRSGSLETHVNVGANFNPTRYLQVGTSTVGGRVGGVLDFRRKGPETPTGSVFAVTGSFHGGNTFDTMDYDIWRVLEMDPIDAGSYLSSNDPSYGTAQGNIPANEPVHGYFNSICFAFNRSDVPIYVSDIAVLKVY